MTPAKEQQQSLLDQIAQKERELDQLKQQKRQLEISMETENQSKLLEVIQSFPSWDYLLGKLLTIEVSTSYIAGESHYEIYVMLGKENLLYREFDDQGNLVQL